MTLRQKWAKCRNTLKFRRTAFPSRNGCAANFDVLAIENCAPGRQSTIDHMQIQRDECPIRNDNDRRKREMSSIGFDFGECRATQSRIEYVFVMTQIVKCIFKTAPKEAAKTKTKYMKCSEREAVTSSRIRSFIADAIDFTISAQCSLVAIYMSRIAMGSARMMYLVVVSCVTDTCAPRLTV